MVLGTSCAAFAALIGVGTAGMCALEGWTLLQGACHSMTKVHWTRSSPRGHPPLQTVYTRVLKAALWDRKVRSRRLEAGVRLRRRSGALPTLNDAVTLEHLGTGLSSL